MSERAAERAGEQINATQRNPTQSNPAEAQNDTRQPAPGSKTPEATEPTSIDGRFSARPGITL